MKIVSFTIIAIFLANIIQGQTVQYSSNNGTAIKGYDPVAYFLQDKAVEGRSDLSFDWSGSTWKFTSQANLDSFKLQPQKYAPQYGGYCAYGVSENHLSATDPEAWTIVADKLYLNYNGKVKEMWMKDKENRIKTADVHWPSINN